MIPEYINCKSEYVTYCDFYMSRDCPETCSYAKDIECVGIGGSDPGLPDLIKKIIEGDNKQ